jgi:hypothetical protein
MSELELRLDPLEEKATRRIGNPKKGKPRKRLHP